MVLIKNTVSVMLVFLCASWLSTARLNPTGAAVNDISDMKASIATSVLKSDAIVKSFAAIDEGNLHKPSAKLVVSKSGKVKSAYSVEAKKRNVRRHYDEVNGGSLAFTADYHRPVHHPPKNN